MACKNVADLQIGKDDVIDEKITAFYGLKPPEYAVYRTGKGVRLHFADDDDAGSKQRRKLAVLNPLRGEVNGLVDGWRTSKSGPVRCRADRYDRLVGDALVLGFAGDVPGAFITLQNIKAKLLQERTDLGRGEYLLAALVIGAALFLLILMLTASRDYGDALDLWRAAGAGTFGAFFSIAMAMRDRTVLPNLQRRANILDAALRMVIGTIAAAVLIALVRIDAVNISFGERSVTQHGLAVTRAYDWLTVLVIGFVAGFSERFVPDLLGRAVGRTEARPVPPPPEEPAPERNQPDPAEDAPAGGAPGRAAGGADDADPIAEEAAVDGCLENVALPAGEVMQDQDLPPAAGGVAGDDAQGGRN